MKRAICIMSFALVGCTGCVTTGGLVHMIPEVKARGYNGRTVGDTSGSRAIQTGNSITLNINSAVPPGSMIPIAEALKGAFSQRIGADNAKQEHEGGGVDASSGEKKSLLDYFRSRDPQPLPEGRTP